MELPSVALLIKEYGVKVNSRRCDCCGRWGLYMIADWTACLACDTTEESRRQAALESLP